MPHPLPRKERKDRWKTQNSRLLKKPRDDQKKRWISAIRRRTIKRRNAAQKRPRAVSARIRIEQERSPSFLMVIGGADSPVNKAPISVVALSFSGGLVIVRNRSLFPLV